MCADGTDRKTRSDDSGGYDDANVDFDCEEEEEEDEASALSGDGAVELLSPRERYVATRKVGEGTFGEVFEGRDVMTGRVVAIKLARLFGTPGSSETDDGAVPKGVLRELWALQVLQNASSNIVQYVAHSARGPRLGLVVGFCETDVAKLAAATAATEGRRGGLGERGMRAVTRMALRGLRATHAAGIVHRDVKPGNLLVDAAGVVKLADFGQCRPLSSPKTDAGDYTHQVSTRWYRAPELLFGARRYGAAVDLWALGCVAACLPRDAPLFPGNSDLEQLVLVFGVLGSPSAERWPSAPTLPDFDKISFPDAEPKVLAELPQLEGLSTEAVAFVDALLRLEPARRADAETALRLAFFSSSENSASDDDDDAAVVAAFVRQRHNKDDRGPTAGAPPGPA